jgi:hypothetical protein
MPYSMVIPLNVKSINIYIYYYLFIYTFTIIPISPAAFIGVARFLGTATRSFCFCLFSVCDATMSDDEKRNCGRAARWRTPSDGCGDKTSR